MNDDIQIIGPIGWRYAAYEDIAANNRVWWSDPFTYSQCNYQAYAAKRNSENCIIVYRITDIEDGHKIEFREPNEYVLSLEQLQNSFSEKIDVATPLKLE